MEEERAALRVKAARAARQLAEDCEREHNLTLAAKWGRWAASLAADDERAFRRLLALLARAGDRAGALQAYDEFSRRLRVEYEAEPAAETKALADEIRRSSAGTAVGLAPPPLPASPMPAETSEPAARAPVGDSSRVDEAPLTTGDSLAHGRYVIERPLGAGGMAAVYLARDVRHRRNVALKVLRLEIGTLLGRRALLHEFRIAASLQHPHIVPLFDSGESDGRVFYVMPHIAGESLRARVARAGEIPREEALHMLREVASALANAHRSGIVHRDIKPENILLAGDAASGDVHALVADFGIAKALDASPSLAGRPTEGSLGVLVKPLGTPGYLAPEQAAGDPVDRPADVYAWGVVAYELLAGVHPFAGRTSPEALMEAHASEPPVPLSERRASIPASLATLVTRCLEKDPAARPADGTRLLAALEGEMRPERPAPGLPSRGRSSGARRAATVVAIAALAAVGTWAAAYVSRYGVDGAKSGAPFLVPRDPASIAMPNVSSSSKRSAVWPDDR